ncbi:MAG: ATP-dependent helicase [Actinomycetota bacterium]|jgi:DNA helicase-2/ATP-dependent DNA helicase PcrA
MGTPDPAVTPDSVLRGLDSDQRQAVTAPTGIVVVRAGAGSGKTTVLTRRIAWRALSDTADISRTLAITFTRQAATEMRARLAHFDFDGQPVIGTFHAVARKMMMQFLDDKGKAQPAIINNRTSVLSTCMGSDAQKGGLNEVLAAIDWTHSHMLPPSVAVEEMSRRGIKIPLGAARFVEVFETYERTKKKRGVVDLNDFLTFVVHEAARDPRFAESLAFQFRHVSVDEAQDMNPLQFEFLKVLLGTHPDVFLVGDPNQAIYGFNGADKSLFDELPGIDAPAHVVTLSSNYRCTPDIVQFAVDTLTQQGQHADAYSRRSPGVPVDLRRFPTDQHEQQHIVRTITQTAISESMNNIAVLCRTNAIVDQVRHACVEAGIPIRSSRRGGDWARAVALATELTGREGLSVWSSDILDSGEYSPDDSDYHVALLVRQFLDENRMGSVNGRTFGSWLATSADISDTDGVEILTFHAAKGREWSHVIVAGCEKGLLPHRSARGPEARAEEARLAYVAFTRAANRLTISWTDQRQGKSSGPSPFLPTLMTTIPTSDPPPPEFRERRRTTVQKNPLETEIHAWRQHKAQQSRVDPDLVLSPRQMKDIVKTSPQTMNELEQLTDPMFVRRHGEELLHVIARAVSSPRH